MQLTISDDQAVLLREVLDSAFRDLRAEIADTDNSRFKAQLREREEQLRAILEHLGGPLADRT